MTPPSPPTTIVVLPFEIFRHAGDDFGDRGQFEGGVLLDGDVIFFVGAVFTVVGGGGVAEDDVG
eukprot:CAMPEP_0182518126 /NCGR_PEP_ID=MMETSP1321-20130603/43599_1 /TAXON_ID=91990 /ORGANISM="Bolidomonas sp., Strain RCC1657" /LENGTH=63 /DNA_ID=CAMNT_0024725959 /DNA_START=96 /DNA_END=287 /DNA_ORIENTATION=+